MIVIMRDSFAVLHEISKSMFWNIYWLQNTFNITLSRMVPSLNIDVTICLQQLMFNTHCL